MFFWHSKANRKKLLWTFVVSSSQNKMTKKYDRIGQLKFILWINMLYEFFVAMPWMDVGLVCLVELHQNLWIRRYWEIRVGCVQMSPWIIQKAHFYACCCSRVYPAVRKLSQSQAGLHNTHAELLKWKLFGTPAKFCTCPASNANYISGSRWQHSRFELIFLH